MSEVTAHHGLLKDTQLHVDDTGGSGRPVLLIHGWPLTGDSWKEQVSALANSGYRAITYDRRGFGRSDKPSSGYTYDTLTEDLNALIEDLDLSDLTLVGFSMGGGEVARYCAKFGVERLHSVVFASAVTPYLLKGADNPDGPLTKTEATKLTASLTLDEESFYEQFITQFFSAAGSLEVSEQQREQALSEAKRASKVAALACMAAWGTTDFRGDLLYVSVPTLVMHGDSDETVPFKGSGKRTHEAISGSELHLIAGAPHGCSISHAREFNAALIEFLAK